MALDLPEAARLGWVEALGCEDALLRPWLLRVLGGATTAETRDFLDSPALELPREEAFAAGDRLGPYVLEALLGEGGMGQVWRASRDDEGPHRAVALKLPHADIVAGAFRQRFRRERDMLAGLAHPHIAALYDAGVGDEGHPYLALELVHGRSVTEWCRATEATLAQRVGLVGQVLAALGYAHARLIVHRDIKPSNVMVTPEGEAKLLDFGIAKLLEGPAGPGAEMLTGLAGRLATTGYAAPEQSEGGQVTAATDLFAVGVLLFELCTGERPWRHHAGQTEAPLASSRVARGARITGAELRGDLDAIMARALSPNPAQRYESAEGFARDLRHWREGRPVSARRVGRLALAAKFIQRNRAASVLAATLAAAVLAGTTGIAWQARRAQREARHAEAVRDFVIELFAKGDPRGGQPSEAMTARQMLDAGADRAEAAFAADPATESELQTTLGNIYDALDDGPRAERSWSRAVDLLRRLHGPADPRVVDATLKLASSEVEFLDEPAALILLGQLRAPLYARYGADSLERARYLASHADALRITHGARDQAIAEDRAAIAIFARHARYDPRYADLLINLSGYLFDAEQYADSLALLDQARAMEIAHHDYDSLAALSYRAEAGNRLQYLGRYDESDAVYAQNMAEAERQFGQHSIWYLHALTGRALMASMRGDRATSNALYLHGMALIRTTSGTNQATALRRSYGAALAREGRPAEAIPLLEQALAETRLKAKDEPNLRRTEEFLGDAYDQAGRTEQARGLLLAARDAWLQYGADEPQGLAARERWARFLLDHGNSTAAAAEFRAVLTSTAGKPFAPAAMAQAGLARIALAAGNKATATTAITQATTMIGAVTMEYDVRQRSDILLTQAEILLASNQISAARNLARQALAATLNTDAPGSPRIAKARSMLAAGG